MLTIEQAAVEYAESLEDNDYTIETEAALKVCRICTTNDII